MTRHLARIGALLLATLLVARGQGADEKYIWIYTLIQEADSLQEKGQGREAVGKYADAMEQLKELQKSYPAWNPKVVNYRLGYLANKLETLGPAQTGPGAKLNVALDTAMKAGNTNAPGTNTVTLADPEQIKAMQTEIARLNDQNSLLQAKLKEALSVQPAAADPRELTKAQEQIQTLQKERDLLQVRLEQEQAKVAKFSDPAAAEQEKKIVDEIKQRLQRQVQLAEALQEENANLKRQVVELKSTAPLPTDKANEQLQITRSMIAILQATNIALRSEEMILEARMAELTKNAVPKSALEAAEHERDELRKQLVAAQKQSRTPSANGMNVEDLERQLQIARARLEAFEAQKIPYTPEELALFKQPDTNKKVEVETKPAKKAIDIPPGAGPLIAEAERAYEAGRLERAENLYMEVLRQDERNLFTLTRLASLQLTLKRFDAAEKTVEKALSVDPQEPRCLYMKGYLRWQQSKFDEALDALAVAAKLRPEEADIQYVMGKVLLQKGAAAQAETALRKTVQLQPRHSEAHYSLALIYLKQKPPLKELAQWHYRKATNLGYPANPDFEKELQAAMAPAVTSTP